MPITACAKSTYRECRRLRQFYTGGSINVFPDESRAACACGDDVQVVDLDTGEVRTTLNGDSEPITSLVVSPDGRHIYSASRSLTTTCWDVSTGTKVRSWKAHKAPTADMAMDPSGRLLATASAAREIRVWDANGCFCTHVFTGHAGIVLRVLFHLSELQVVSAGDDGAVILWDLVERAATATFTGHSSAVTALAWAPDGWRLLTAGRDRIVNMWDVQTLSKLRTIAVFESIETLAVLPPGCPCPGHSGKTPAVAGKEDVCVFATGGESGVIKLWDAETGACRYKQSSAATGAGSAGNDIVEVVALSRSKQLVVARANCQISRVEIAAAALHSARTLIGSTDQVTAVCFAGAAVPTHGAPPGVPDQGGLQPLPASLPPWLVIATNSDVLHVLSTATLGCEAALTGHGDTVLALSTACVAEQWLVASGGKDGTLRIWHLASGKCIAVGSGHLGAVTGLAFGFKGEPMLVSGSEDKLLRVWGLDAVWTSLQQGELPASAVALAASATVVAHAKDVNCVAIAPNNKLLASGGADRVAKVWQLPSLAAPLTLSGHRRGVWDVAFAPLDQVVMTASGDATIRLWSVKDGACMRTLAGHSASVLRVSFLTLGTQVLSTGSDGLMKLWTVATGECVATFEAEEDKVWALAVAGEDDAAVATGAADGALALWADCSKAEREAARAQSEARVLTQQAMENALNDKDYVKAAHLAFQLQQPGRLLSVVSRAISQPAPEGSAVASDTAGHSTLCRLVKQFSKEELARALTYLRDWNTSSRTCHSAQALLHAILATHPPEVLVALPGFVEISEGVLLYSERHMRRMARLRQSTYLVDYLLQAANVLCAGGNDASRSSPVAATCTPREAAVGAHATLCRRFLAGIDALSSMVPAFTANGAERPLIALPVASSADGALKDSDEQRVVGNPSPDRGNGLDPRNGSSGAPAVPAHHAPRSPSMQTSAEARGAADARIDAFHRAGNQAQLSTADVPGKRKHENGSDHVHNADSALHANGELHTKARRKHKNAKLKRQE